MEFFLTSASFTAADKALAFSNKALFSSPFAAPTDLERVFCSARSASNSTIAVRRFSSAARAKSTKSTFSPRAFCEARTRSGLSRSTFTSIIYIDSPARTAANQTSASLNEASAVAGVVVGAILSALGYEPR